MAVTLSIIIPAYNAGQYLEDCIESILASTYKDYELLLIDDGSQDNTGEICDRYAEDNTNTKVYHTKNQGLPSARNVGIDNAQGKYIGFVDADDVVAPDMFAFLISAMELGVQLAVCRFLRCHRAEIAVLPAKPETPVMFDKVGTARNILNGVYGSYVWNKLYSKAVIDRYGVRFIPDSQGCEDLFFNTTYLQYCSQSAFVSQELYYYIVNYSSIMETFRRSQRVTGQYVSLPRANRYAAKVMKDIDLDLALYAQARATMYYQTVLRKIDSPTEDYISEAVDYVRKHKNTLLRFRWGFKYYISSLIMCIGYPLWSRVFRGIRS